MANGLAFQAVTEPKNKHPNRYPDAAISALVEATRKTKGDSTAKMAEVIGLEPTSWYKKADGVTPFKVAELGRIAHYWGMPSGWPFVQVDTDAK